ncbi:MAG: ATP-dependent protease [Nitrospirales bacterium]|nr:MAG: ATP-dependent protease [Nitrospirales bacterium]
MFSDAHSTPPETFAVPEIIPFFPLPNVVFFPHTYLPLHIFEPRYRAMIEDTVAKGDCIGMALLKDGWETQYYQAPPIHDLGCVGRIVSAQKLSDGRFNIVLKGLCRARYDELSVEAPYRQAKLHVFPDTQESLDLDSRTRTKLVEMAVSYLDLKKAKDLSELLTSEDLTDGVLVNSLSAGLDLTPLEKQFLLEAEQLFQRARRLTDLLKFKLADLQSSAQG